MDHITGLLSRGPKDSTGGTKMSKKTLRELASIVDGLDEDHHDYREVRAAKRLIHDLLKDAEAAA
jgi:hypothetical protein